MAKVSITGPGEGELIVNGPSTIRILEDGQHRPPPGDG